MGHRYTRWTRSGRCGPGSSLRGERRVDRLRARAPQSTSLALSAAPDAVEALLRGVEPDVILGEQTHLEVSPSGALGAQTRSGEVGAAEVEQSTIDGDELQVHPGALAHREPAVAEARLACELGAERPARDARVEEAKLDPCAMKRRERVEHRDEAPLGARGCTDRGLHAHLLHVCRGNPQGDSGTRDRLPDELVVVIRPVEQSSPDRARGEGCRRGGSLHRWIFTGRSRLGQHGVGPTRRWFSRPPRF